MRDDRKDRDVVLQCLRPCPDDLAGQWLRGCRFAQDLSGNALNITVATLQCRLNQCRDSLAKQWLRGRRLAQGLNGRVADLAMTVVQERLKNAVMASLGNGCEAADLPKTSAAAVMATLGSGCEAAELPKASAAVPWTS